MTNKVYLKLNNKYSFWITFFSNNKLGQINEYEENLKEFGSFDSAEEFWNYYQHMKPLNQLPKGSSYFLFKNDIKPSWEDTKNIGGGKFIIAIKKDDSGNKIWEDLLLELMTNAPETQLINGVVANSKSSESLLSIWTSKIDNQEMFNIRHWLKKILGLPVEISIKYKEHPNNEEIKKKQKELQKIEEKRRMQQEKDFLLS